MRRFLPGRLLFFPGRLLFLPGSLLCAQLRFAWLLCVGLVGAGCDLRACNEADPAYFSSAEFGVFYGGQIQERREIPFVVDETKQQQGFRIVLAEPLEHPLAVRWELSRPGAARKEGTTDPDARVTELGEAMLPAGERHFEKRFPFQAGDPLGLWNIRVTLGDRLAIDRPFTVYDRAARRRAKRQARPVDAGG